VKHRKAKANSTKLNKFYHVVHLDEPSYQSPKALKTIKYDMIENSDVRMPLNSTLMRLNELMGSRSSHGKSSRLSKKRSLSTSNLIPAETNESNECTISSVQEMWSRDYSSFNKLHAIPEYILNSDEPILLNLGGLHKREGWINVNSNVYMFLIFIIFMHIILTNIESRKTLSMLSQEILKLSGCYMT
jgi:hypothetical protein